MIRSEAPINEELVVLVLSECDNDVDKASKRLPYSRKDIAMIKYGGFIEIRDGGIHISMGDYVEKPEQPKKTKKSKKAIKYRSGGGRPNITREEEDDILWAYELCDGNASRAYRMLGYSQLIRSDFYYS